MGIGKDGEGGALKKIQSREQPKVEPQGLYCHL